MSDDDTRYAAAKDRVEQRVSLAVHWLAFAGVNVGLAAAFGFEPTAGYLWGWGIGLAAHSVYAMWHLSGWNGRLIERELGRDPR